MESAATPTHEPHTRQDHKKKTSLKDAGKKIQEINGLARRRDISRSLSQLDGRPPKEQAEFWKSCVVTRSEELEEIGGLPPDEIFNDSLNRYFDSSMHGLYRVFALCLRDQHDDSLAEQGLLSKQGMKDALNEHFQYYRSIAPRGDLVPEAQECFDRLCDKMEVPINEVCFGYAVRRLRLGILLKMYPLLESSAEVYHMDYDEHRIYTPFNGHMKDKFKPVYYKRNIYTIPVLKKQDPVEDLEEYLFTSKMKRGGTTHWVHLQHPKISMVLAIGQVYRMPGTIQSTMRNLKQAQPQIRLSQTLEHKKDHSPLAQEPEESIEPSYEWSSLIYPGICLDYASQKSLEDFQKWFRKQQKARSRGDVPEAPPPVYVAAVQFSMGVVWSDHGTNTIVTMCGQATYIGKWISDVPHKQEKSCWTKFLDFCTCSGSRSKRSEGYQELSQDDPDQDPEIGLKTTCPKLLRETTASLQSTHELAAHFLGEAEDEAGMEASDGRVSRVTFDGVFEKTLLALESKNSVLRTGDNMQLMTRIMLNSTQEYLDIAAVYECAIHRIDWLLDIPGNPDKDSLICKIEDAKLELGTLLRLVEPFAAHVVSDLTRLPAQQEIVKFQIKLIDNNVHTFVPKCKALIQQCDSLTDSYNRKASAKMNNILNILTFITFVITPMQLLTSLYGMNFRIMPELHWNHGYAYFWGVSITLSLLSALLLYRCTQEES